MSEMTDAEAAKLMRRFVTLSSVDGAGMAWNGGRQVVFTFQEVEQAQAFSQFNMYESPHSPVVMLTVEEKAACIDALTARMLYHQNQAMDGRADRYNECMAAALACSKAFEKLAAGSLKIQIG